MNKYKALISKLRELNPDPDPSYIQTLIIQLEKLESIERALHRAEELEPLLPPPVYSSLLKLLNPILINALKRLPKT